VPVGASAHNRCALLLALLLPVTVVGAEPTFAETKPVAAPEPVSPFGALTPVVQLGHRGPVRALCFSSDGKLLASSGADYLVRLWEVSSGHLLRVLRGHRAPVNGLGFGGSNRWLVSASEDGSLRLWNLADGTVRARIDVGLPLHSAAVSPDGRLLAASAGGSYGASSTIHLFEAASGEELVRLAGHRAPVHQLDFTADSRSLLSASADRTARLWSIQTWGSRAARLVRSFEGSHAAMIPVSGQIATAGAHPYRSVTVSELDSGRRVKRLDVGFTGIDRLVASPSGLYLAVGNRQGAVRVIAARSGRSVHSLEGSGPLAFSADGRLLAVARSDGRIGLWEPTRGRLHLEIPGRPGGVNALDFSSDGRRLAAADSDGTTRIWNVEAGRLIRKLLGHEAAVRSVAYAPTRSFVATAGDDGYLLVFDTALGKLHEEVEIPGVQRLLYSGDGTQLAAAAPGQTIVVPSGRRRRGLGLCISPDSKRIVQRLPGWPLQVHDLRSGELVAQVGVPDATAAAFSPDGAVLAAAGPDGRLVFSDPASGDRLRVLPAEGGRVLALAYAPDGILLAVARRDGGVRIRDAATGELRHRLWLAGAVRDVRFSTDGRLLAAAGDDAVLRLWRPGTGELLLQAVGLPGHDFIGLWTDGRILLSSGAAGRLRFTQGYRTYDLSEALHRLPNPELVAPLD